MHRFFIILCFLVASQGLIAEPIVIHDTGTARSIRVYFPIPTDIEKPPTLSEEDKKFIEAEREAAIKHLASFFYPVTSTAWSRGKIASHKVNYPQISKPFFLIGTDKFSVRWVQLNKQELINRGAIGFLIKVQTPEEYANIQAQFPEFSIQPLDGNQMANALNINKYPVFISATEVIQ